MCAVPNQRDPLPTATVADIGKSPPINPVRFRSTLLHALCRRDRGGRPMNDCTECAAILLAAGAMIFARDKDGITPLALAKRNNLLEMVEFLSACDAE
jgi:ankyrin repeat protein